MINIGDIIVVENYIAENDVNISKHSFIVINNKSGFIEGIPYDFAATVMSSFKDENHRLKKLRFEENLEILTDNIISNKNINTKDGYAKIDKIVLFNKKNTSYYVLGHISDDLLIRLLSTIIILDIKNKIIYNKNNLIEMKEEV